MTQTGDADLGKLGDSRSKLFKSFLWGTSNANLQSTLTELAYNYMRTVVLANNPSYHPAVRYNAVLILGMLDEQYGIDSGAGRRPPKPYPQANVLLTQIVNAAADDKAVPPSLVFGALQGLERHAQFKDSLPPDAVTAMTAALLKLVNREKPLQEMDPDVYSWMRLRAASALSRLGTVGAKNAIYTAIVKLAASGKSLDDRCAAAALLANIKYKDVKLNDAGSTEPLFALARDVAAAEDKRAEDFQNRGTTGFVGRPGPGPEAYAGGTGEQDTYPRRLLLSHVVDLQTALNAVKGAVPPETQKKIDDVLAATNIAVKAASDKDTVGLGVADAVRKMADAINKAVPSGTEKPAADKATEAFQAAAKAQ